MSVKNDRRRRMMAPILCTVIIILFMIALDGFILWGNTVEPLPVILLLVILALPFAVAVGVGIALIQRIQEIRKGEADETIQY